MLRRQKKKLLYTLSLVFGVLLTFLGIGRDTHVDGVLKNYSIPTAEADTPPPAYSQSSYYNQGSYYGQSGYYNQSGYYGQGTYYNQSGYYNQGTYYYQSGYDGDGDAGDGDDGDDDGDGCP